MDLYLAKILRKQQTDAENLMWYYLRNKRLGGFKFKRQQILGKYIVDFVCFQKRLIIELDGGQHAHSQPYDDQRTHWLKLRGYEVIRFWNNEVLVNTELVLEEIWNYLNKNPSP